MEAKEIFSKALNTNYLIIKEEELQAVLDNSELIRIEDTHLSDFIRLIKFDGILFIQELSLKE